MKIKNWKMKTGVMLSTLLLLATATVPNALAFSVTQNNVNQNGISVDIKQIKELSDNNLLASDATPSQALAQTIATLISQDPSGDNGNFTEVLDANDVLKYFYPNYTAEELKGATITLTQAVKWLNFKGYTATIVDRALTTDEIKKHLDNSEPIVTVLETQNSQNWLNQNYAGVLYGHSDVETGVADGKLHASFIKTVNYGEAILNDGTEAQAFQFPDLKYSPDPIQAESSFKWVSTITGIKRDPSWTNSQTIQGDKAKGVFAHKVTSDGTQSQVDFTDPEVTALLNKYPIENKEHVLKLAAVSLINLYEDKDHQKTVKDLEDFLKISSSTYATTQNIIDWYKYLGFDFDVVNGRAPMTLTKALNDSGRLYLTMFKAQDKANSVKNTAAIGVGYLNNSFNGYSPYWYTVKLGENTVPFYNVPLTPAGMKQQQELAKTFKYTNVKRVVSDPFSKTDYEEEKTIYNIRLKGTPDESGITNKPDESVETPPTDSNVAPTTNASYTRAPYFNIRETQNQEPWCSSYVNAGAVNTVYKAPLDDSDTKGAVTTAKKLMQLDLPGVSDEELATLPGTTIQHVLEVMQKNYNITADFEMRTLSFAEVKNEIDAGGIVQIDGNNSESTDAPGTGENSGHAVAIVGYVMPKESNQAPYYIVWNPWWDSTFYLSSQAKTFNLGGTKYKWTRTWHNWRKTNGTRSVQKLDPSIGDQKVMNTANPDSLKKLKNINVDLGIPGQFNYNLSDFNSKRNVLNTAVAEFSKVNGGYDTFKGLTYFYGIGKQVSGKQFISATQNTTTKNRDYTSTAKEFTTAVDSMSVSLAAIGQFGFSTILITACILAAQAVPVAGQLATIIGLILGGGIETAELAQLANNIIFYKQASITAINTFGRL